MKKKSALAITIAIIGLVWAFAIIAYTMIADLPWLCWGSITCTMIAIAITEIYLLVFRKNSGAQGTEAGALGIIFTVCFLTISTLLNTVFVLVEFGDFNWLLVTLNLVVIAGYFVVLLWVEQSAVRLARQLKKAEEKTMPSINIARKLGELIAITEDLEIKDKLLELKQAVSYSSNITTNATIEKDAQMSALLDELAQLTIAQTDRLIILNKVEMVEKVWRMRSSIASSIR